jgi:hypothetical protein
LPQVSEIVKSDSAFGKLLIATGFTIMSFMQKSKIFLFLFCFISLFANSSEAQISQAKKSKKFIRPKQVNNQGCTLGSYSTIGNKVVTAHYNCQPTIKTLTLSQTEIYAGCLNKEKMCSNTIQKVDVEVEATDPEHDVLSYIYKVSGGKIIGQDVKAVWRQDTKVVWDLTGINPGTYRISVEVDDGFGVRAKTVTKEIKVIECPNCN